MAQDYTVVFQKLAESIDRAEETELANEARMLAREVAELDELRRLAMRVDDAQQQSYTTC
jgi:hypothetical protein